MSISFQSSNSTTVSKLERPRSLVERDVDFIYQTIRDNHPGICNSLDPTFSEKVEEIFSRAKALLASSTSILEQKQIAQNLGREFQDSHLFVSYYQNEDGKKCKGPAEKFFGISFPQEDVVWITIPTFQPNLEQEAHLKTIIQACQNFRTKTVVFDIRGNGGGNSAWGAEILESLFGSEYAHACKQKLYENVFVEWRASPGNLEYAKKFPSILANQFGSDHVVLKWANEIVLGLQSALDSGQNYYLQYDEESLEVSDTTDGRAENLFQGKIFVLVDRFVGSASLDFLDRLKAMDKTVKLVGGTTGKDSCYMELRRDMLPSGEGVFGFPIKVYRNRPRGHNQPYHPDIPCMEIMSDEAKLKEYVLKQISSK